jgi:hypothetical protein
MPTTPGGIVYPNSSDHTRIWEHLQDLAESIDASREWEDYSPSLVGMVSPASLVARYQQIGKTITFYLQAIAGAGSSFPAVTWSFNLPAPVRGGTMPSFAGELFDVAAGLSVPATTSRSTDLTQIMLTTPTAAGGAQRLVSSTVPFSWNTGDRLSFSGSYERA